MNMPDGMGNIRSSIQFPEMGMAKDTLGDIYSDIVSGFQTAQAQKTAIALAQQQTAQAQAAAAAAQAQARAEAQPKGMFAGLSFSPWMMVPAVAVLGGVLYLKMKRRRK